MDKATFAHRISLVLNPLVVLTILIALVAFEASKSSVHAAFFAFLAFFFSCVLPMIPVIHLRRLDKVDGWFIPERSKRIRPLLLAGASFWLGVAVFYVLEAPGVFDALMVCVAVSSVIAFFISIKWKISLHALGVWAGCVIVMILYGYAGWLAVVPAGLVSWARFALGLHSHGQILAGSVVGIGVAFAVFKYFLGGGV